MNRNSSQKTNVKQKKNKCLNIIEGKIDIWPSKTHTGLEIGVGAVVAFLFKTNAVKCSFVNS